MAAETGELDILRKLWEWAEEVETPEDLKSLLLAKDNSGRTAWHVAAERGSLDVLHTLWEWAKKFASAR
jgi:ankyrin repeat protein